MWSWIVGGVVVGVCAVVALQYRAQRGTYRSLSSRMPERLRTEDAVPLGMEAMDLDAVDRVNRRNESLERSTSGFLRTGMATDTAARRTSVAPMADDENYAKRFYTAFLKNKPKD